MMMGGLQLCLTSDNASMVTVAAEGWWLAHNCCSLLTTLINALAKPQLMMAIVVAVLRHL